MRGANQQYTREMREHFGYSAVWLPTTVLALGDVGRLTNYEFQRIAGLADFGISFEETAAEPQASLNHSSANSVAVKVKLAGALPNPGSALAQADAGVQLSFGSGNATFFQAGGCHSVAIRNLIALREAIAPLEKEGEWEGDYVVVTEVIEARSATIVISSSENAMIELRADGAVNLNAAKLADAEIGFQVTQSRNIATQLIAENGLTPLFRAHGLQRRLFKQPTLTQRSVRGAAGIGDAGPGGDLLMRELDYEDF